MTLELNITKFFTEECMRDFSASIAEIGNDAGPSTWRAACEAAEDHMFVTADNRDEFVSHFRSFGAWSDDELATFTDAELNAMLLQCIAGDVRESSLDGQNPPDWDEYEAGCEAGRYSGRIGRGIDPTQVLYTIGD